MKQLYIDLRNCYGIGEMNSDIKFGKGKNACVIYAPVYHHYSVRF